MPAVGIYCGPVNNTGGWRHSVQDGALMIQTGGWARIKFGPSPYFLSGGFDFFVVDNSDGEVLSVPIVLDIRLILARRADTWDGPYEEQVGFVVLICVSALTVSCRLWRPRIIFGATQ